MFVHYLKKIIRDKSKLFWNLVFPLALMTCFRAAFSNIYEAENQLNPVACAVVYSDRESELANSFASTLQTLDDGEERIENGEKKLVILKPAKDETEAMTLLKSETVKGIYYVKEDTVEVLFSNKCGNTDSMILRGIADAFLNNYEIRKEAVKAGKAEQIAEITEVMSNTDGLLAEKKGAFSNEPNPYEWFFYAAFGMSILFYIQWGVALAADVQANMSGSALRTAVSPIKKTKLILSVFGAYYTTANLISVVTLFCMRYVFGIDMGDRLELLLLFVLAGNLFSLSCGMALGTMLSGSVEHRTNILTACLMISVFLGGEMLEELPGFFEKELPIINDINPATVLNMALYQVTNFSNLSNFYTEMLKIFIVSVLMLVLAILRTRRERYASL